MRTLLLVFLVALASLAVAAPQRLDTYQKLMAALEAGKEVRVVIHYAKTKLKVDGKDQPAPDAIGGMKVGEWEQFAKGVVRNPQAYVAFSETVLIAHPGYGTVLNYVRLRVMEDGTVQITARYYDPKTYEIKMDETFTGEISNGKDGKGVSFFAPR